MIPVLDSRGMREVDRVTISKLGLPSLVLMESAASAVSEIVSERFPDAGRVVMVCVVTWRCYCSMKCSPRSSAA